MTGAAAAALRFHGGRVDLAAQLHPDAPLPWIDLSTGINPIAYPIPPLPPEAFTRLPWGAELEALCEAAAEAYGLPQGATILPTPGSEIAIRLAPRLLADAPGAQVGILAPTYGSHAAAWRAAGAQVQELEALPGADASLDALVLVNPNNPDGRAVDVETLRSFAERWCAAGKRLVVDEAFADVRPELSLLGGAALPRGAVVLRSLGKFFGLAGLRLGFVTMDAQDAAPWRDLLGDWAASGPACAVATRALRDTEWIAMTRQRLAADRRRLDETLTTAGLTACGGTDLFGLYQDKDGRDLVDGFARAGILIRGFTHGSNRYRFGLPGDDAAWRRLEQTCVMLQGQKTTRTAAI